MEENSSSDAAFFRALVYCIQVINESPDKLRCNYIFKANFLLDNNEDEQQAQDEDNEIENESLTHKPTKKKLTTSSLKRSGVTLSSIVETDQENDMKDVPSDENSNIMIEDGSGDENKLNTKPSQDDDELDLFGSDDDEDNRKPHVRLKSSKSSAVETTLEDLEEEERLAEEASRREEDEEMAEDLGHEMSDMEQEENEEDDEEGEGGEEEELMTGGMFIDGEADVESSSRKKKKRKTTKEKTKKKKKKSAKKAPKQKKKKFNEETSQRITVVGELASLITSPLLRFTVILSKMPDKEYYKVEEIINVEKVSQTLTIKKLKEAASETAHIKSTGVTKPEDVIAGWYSKHRKSGIKVDTDIMQALAIIKPIPEIETMIRNLDMRVSHFQFASFFGVDALSVFTPEEIAAMHTGSESSISFIIESKWWKYPFDDKFIKSLQNFRGKDRRVDEQLLSKTKLVGFSEASTVIEKLARAEKLWGSTCVFESSESLWPEQVIDVFSSSVQLSNFYVGEYKKRMLSTNKFMKLRYIEKKEVQDHHRYIIEFCKSMKNNFEFEAPENTCFGSQSLCLRRFETDNTAASKYIEHMKRELTKDTIVVTYSLSRRDYLTSMSHNKVTVVNYSNIKMCKTRKVDQIFIDRAHEFGTKELREVLEHFSGMSLADFVANPTNSDGDLYGTSKKNRIERLIMFGGYYGYSFGRGSPFYDLCCYQYLRTKWFNSFYTVDPIGTANEIELSGHTEGDYDSMKITLRIGDRLKMHKQLSEDMVRTTLNREKIITFSPTINSLFDWIETNRNTIKVVKGDPSVQAPYLVPYTVITMSRDFIKNQGELVRSRALVPNDSIVHYHDIDWRDPKLKPYVVVDLASMEAIDKWDAGHITRIFQYTANNACLFILGTEELFNRVILTPLRRPKTSFRVMLYTSEMN